MSRNHTYRSLFLLFALLWVSLSYSQEVRSGRIQYRLSNLPDTTAPVFQILTPALKPDQANMVKEGFIILSGEVTDESEISLLAVQSEKQVPDENGRFSVSLKLFPGENQIRLVSADIYQNLSETVLSITYEPGQVQFQDFKSWESILTEEKQDTDGQ
jgi:hypothetical protein